MASTVVEQLTSKALQHLFTKIRDRNTNPTEFRLYASRLMRILAEEGIARVEDKPKVVTTPTGDIYEGVTLFSERKLCVVSIIRAGDSLLEAVLACEPSVSVGKILIQRDETSVEKTPVMYYSKLPPNVSNMNVMLVDPMLATGGSAMKAIETLVAAGVPEERILFLNVVSCPEGLEALNKTYPGTRNLTFKSY